MLYLSLHVLVLINKILFNPIYERNFNYLVTLCILGDWFEYRFVGNHEDRFVASRPICFTMLRYYGNKNGRQNRLKIGKLPLWTKFKDFRYLFF